MVIAVNQDVLSPMVRSAGPTIPTSKSACVRRFRVDHAVSELKTGDSAVRCIPEIARLPEKRRHCTSDDRELIGHVGVQEQVQAFTI